jgi:hypothetical protein
VSYLHTKDISQVEHISFRITHLLEFIAAQFAMFGPMLFPVLIIALYKNRKDSEVSFIWPQLLCVVILSLVSKALANWAAPVYIAGIVLSVAYLIQHNRKTILKLSLIFNIIVMILFHHYYDLIPKIVGPLHAKTGSYLARDPFWRMHGWRELGAEISAIQQRYPQATLMVDERKLIAELYYYVTPHPQLINKWNITTEIKDHYDLTAKVNLKNKEQEFLFVTRKDDLELVKSYFSDIILLKKINIPLYTDYQLNYNIYYVR